MADGLGYGDCEVRQGDAIVELAGLMPASIDFVYLDPPFGTGRIWEGEAGQFSDRFGFDAAAAERSRRHSTLFDLLTVVPPATRAHVLLLADVLDLSRAALRLTGSLWLHHDDTAGAYLRIAGDLIFGPDLARGLVVWRRSYAHNGASRKYGRVHDTIAVWGRSRAADWRFWRARGPYLIAADPCEHLGRFDAVELGIGPLNQNDAERNGYPTQKPVALLRRLIACATLPGDLVLDPMCGSGTTLVAARQLGRRALGFDRSADAVTLAQHRLTPAQSDLFGFLPATSHA